MPAEKEGVCPLPGKPRCRLRKPEQDIDRGTEIPKRTLLPERCPNLGLIDTCERWFFTQPNTAHTANELYYNLVTMILL